MKVTTEKMEGSRVLLEVESPEQVVEEALDSAYRKIVKRVEIPGFRRGKAPKSLVARYYASELYDEAIRQAVSEEYLKAVEEAEIQPVDDPEFSDIHFVEGESLRFKASVQVYPEVELEEYNDIAIPFEMPTVSEEDVDEQIEMLKERMAELRPLEGDLVLEPGHYATCHIKTIDAHDDDSLHLQLDIDEDLNYLEVGHEYPVIPGPVSYTHLDVYKRQVPYILTVAAVVLIVVSVFFTFIPGVSVEIDQWYILGTAMVCCVGLVNLTSVHIKNIKRKGRDWDLSILLIVLTFGYLIYGLVKGRCV